MAIHFEWYENPVPPNQPDEKKLHARITYNGKIGTDYVSCLLYTSDAADE